MSNAVQSMLQQALSCFRDQDFAGTESVCRTILSDDEAQPDAWHLLGLALLQRGEVAASIDAFENAIAQAPAVAAFHINFASALTAAGRLDDAVTEQRRGLSLDDVQPDGHFNLGNSLLAMGRPDEAAQSFEKTLALAPDHAAARNNLGHVLRQRGDLDAAISQFRQATESDSRYAPAWSNLCGALLESGQTVAAIDAGRRATVADPNNAEGHYNLGNAYSAAPIVAEAAACYRRALQIDRRYTDAWVNLGAALQHLGECEAAITVLDQALELEPGLPQAQWNKATALLLSGQLCEGWALYEWRWRAVAGLTLPAVDRPRWDGASPQGQRLLVVAEQGLGDTIQFVRYASMLRVLGAHVTLECPASLKTLLEGSNVADRLIAAGESRPEVDAWTPLMSLPGLLGTDMDSIPADCPYLSAASADVPMTPDERALKVGIVWRGSLTNNRGRFRSCALSDLEPLTDVPGIQVFSLQTELAPEDAARLELLGIVDLGSGFDDFSGSAAAVQSMDLIVSVDTAMAHLAGALGKSVWTMLSTMPDWRWFLDRADSPWYPTMRLFRQRRVSDWAQVVGEVSAALAELKQPRLVT